MELNNLENQIREQLNKREIQPSLPAWDRLDAMLSVQESKLEKKKSFPWIKIAAGILLFIGIGYFFLISAENKIESKEEDIVELEQIENSLEKELKSTNVIVNSSKQLKSNEKLLPIVHANSKSTTHKYNDNRTNLQNDTQPEVFSKMVTEKQVVAIDVKQEKTNESGGVEVVNNQNNNLVVADVKVTQKPKLKVDPNALLKQVDGEIELTFRQKVMKTITKGYKEAKEAVASRNQESSINY